MMVRNSHDLDSLAFDTVEEAEGIAFKNHEAQFVIMHGIGPEPRQS
jgi:hypothetical protein